MPLPNARSIASRCQHTNNNCVDYYTFGRHIARPWEFMATYVTYWMCPRLFFGANSYPRYGRQAYLVYPGPQREVHSPVSKNTTKWELIKGNTKSVLLSNTFLGWTSVASFRNLTIEYKRPSGQRYHVKKVPIRRNDIF